MKKAAAILTSLAFVLSVSPAIAREIDGPDAARHAHRAQKIAERKARGPEVPAAAEAKAKAGPSFWEREGERSGLGNAGGRMGTFFKNMNPVPFFKDQETRYQERKGGSSAK